MSDQCRTIVMVDDDGDDCLLVRDALRAAGRLCDIRFLHNGEELFDYLRREGEYEAAKDLPFPDLILLDMKMPRKDGRETIRELKADPRWRHIPVVALTTSSAYDDIAVSYDSGVNAYITKPTTFRKLVETVDMICKYWFDLAELPPRAHGGIAN